MNYKRICKECGNTISYTEDDEYIVCPECGRKTKNPHYVTFEEDVDFEEPRERIVYVHDQPKEKKDKGSYGVGFLLGFFLGLIGLIIAIAMDQEETKRGALHAFIIGLVLGGLAVGLVMCVGLGAVYGATGYTLIETASLMV